MKQTLRTVVYFDLELSDLQFQARYSEKYEDSEGKRSV